MMMLVQVLVGVGATDVVRWVGTYLVLVGPWGWVQL